MRQEQELKEKDSMGDNVKKTHVKRDSIRKKSIVKNDLIKKDTIKKNHMRRASVAMTPKKNEDMTNS